jgi:hypothetical protein
VRDRNRRREVYGLARIQLNRAALGFVLACVALFAVGISSASGKVYSFKPVGAKGGSVVFVIDGSVRPASVRAARFRIGHYKPRRLSLTKARRAVRRGRLRLPIAPIAGGGTEAPAVKDEAVTLAQRASTLKIVADLEPPQTTIASGPSGSVDSRSASFQFAASERHGRFECKLDSSGWGRCDSPKSYTQLAPGAHLFAVRAIDRAGNVDPTPATRAWTVEAPAPPPPPSESLPPGAPMVDGFETANGPNGLITNEYAGWHGSDATAVQSSLWQSDGGSLFSAPTTGPNGEPIQAAYTGKLDSDSADRYSQTNTHSNKMRFWTKASGYGNVRLAADIKPLAWGAGVPSTWGGFKFYLRREKGVTESAFYTAEPYIYDGHAYIQKKCLGDTGGGNYSTGGTYYLLASKSSLDVPLGSWHEIAATARTNPDGSVTIELFRDGALVLTAVDRGIRSDGTGCPPLTAGHVGFRSDFLQYYLDDFGVTPQ